MKRKIFVFIFLTIHFPILSQNILPSIDSMQGIWHCHCDIDFNDYMLIDDNRMISIAVFGSVEVAISENPFGYIGLKFRDDPLPKKIAELGKKGDIIISYKDSIRGYDLKGNLKNPAYNSQIIFNEGNEESKTVRSFSIIGVNGVSTVFVKMDTIPDKVLILLKKNAKDWIKYKRFVAMQTGIISVEKTFIFNDKFDKTKSYLLKNDEIEVLRKKGKWLEIKYYGTKVVSGWIKKDDMR